MRGVASMVVGDDDTSLSMGSGDVPVLATPRLVALCEGATCAALGGQLQPGCTTVGMRVQIDHLHPTAVGQSVEAEAILDKIEGRRLTFTGSASDAKGPLAAGKVTRVVVELEQFLAKTH